MKHEMFTTVVTSGALRGKWEFEYSAKDLAEAAATQAKDRRERKAKWQAKYDEVLTQIKSKGLDVRESLTRAMASTYSGSTHAGAPTVHIDRALQEDLLEAHGRVEIHDKAIQEYEGWHAVMTAQGGRNVQLTHADWMYFFGGLDKGE